MFLVLPADSGNDHQVRQVLVNCFGKLTSVVKEEQVHREGKVRLHCDDQLQLNVEAALKQTSGLMWYCSAIKCVNEASDCIQ